MRLGWPSWELSVPGRLCVSQAACRFPMGKWKRGWLRGYEWRGRPQGCKWRLLPPGCRRWAMLMGMPWEVSRRAGRALERRFGATVCQRASLCFFGIKKKFKGIVYKRRLALTLPAALAFVSGLPYEQACARWPLPDAGLAAVALAPATRQIARELEAAMNRWLPLAPSMGIACDRVAWAYRPEVREARGCDELLDAELRITFDDCLAYFDCHCFRSPWRPIIESSESVMEIKSAVPYPPWLVDVLSAERIYPASFTKYGNAYQMATAVPRARNHRRAMRGGA